MREKMKTQKDWIWETKKVETDKVAGEVKKISGGDCGNAGEDVVSDRQ